MRSCRWSSYCVYVLDSCVVVAFVFISSTVCSQVQVYRFPAQVCLIIISVYSADINEVSVH